MIELNSLKSSTNAWETNTHFNIMMFSVLALYRLVCIYRRVFMMPKSRRISSLFSCHENHRLLLWYNLINIVHSVYVAKILRMFCPLFICITIWIDYSVHCAKPNLRPVQNTQNKIIQSSNVTTLYTAQTKLLLQSVIRHIIPEVQDTVPYYCIHLTINSSVWSKLQSVVHLAPVYTGPPINTSLPLLT